MKISLALSGGGFRATVYHLGVLARLAKDNRLEDVNFLSTVSGGSLCVGLVFALNDFQWPTSFEYLQKVLPEARRLLTTYDLQRSLIVRTLVSFWNIFDTRADDLSALMQEHWGVSASLRDLPKEPRWMINATCYETGKNWRFERFRMGDYLYGYTYDTNIPVSDAMAASAGFPGGIGPLVIDASKHSWFKYIDRPGAGTLLMDPEDQVKRKTEPLQPEFSQAHLWDGGVYDNQGLEGLHNFVTGWRKNVEFLVVSDASGPPKTEKYARGVKALLRMATGIMKEQIRALRARAVVERLINHEDDKGVYLQTGNTCHEVLSNAAKQDEIPELCQGCLDEREARLAAEMPTVIRKLTESEYERLFRHGFEVADYTLYAYYPDEFKYVGYQNLIGG
jgi:NTE family protein